MSYTKQYIILPTLAIFAVVGYFLPTLSTHPWSRYTTPAAVVFLALPTFYGLYRTVGLKRSVLTAAILGMFGILIETIGIYTCFPYSCFEYGTNMGTKLFGTTPWTVAFAWAPLVLGAYALVWKPDKSTFKLVTQGTLLLIIFDLVLDPTATALGFWVWESPGMYYGIPLTNFLGWVVSGVTGMYVCVIGCKKEHPHPFVLYTSAYSLAVWSGASIYLQMIIPSIFATFTLISVIMKIYGSSSPKLYSKPSYYHT